MATSTMSLNFPRQANTAAPTPEERRAALRARRISMPATGIDLGKADPQFGRTLKRSSVAGCGPIDLGLPAPPAPLAVPRPPLVTVASTGKPPSFLGRRSLSPGPIPHNSPAEVQRVPSLAGLRRQRTQSCHPLRQFSSASCLPGPPTTPTRPADNRRLSYSHTERQARLKKSTVQNVVEESKRRNVAKELVETERRYVALLEAIVEHYLQPVTSTLETASSPRASMYVGFGTLPALGLGVSNVDTGPTTKSGVEESGPILTKRVVDEIFCNLPQILTLSKSLLASLEFMATESELFDTNANIETVPTPLVGQAIGPLLPYLKLYSAFTTNFQRSQASLFLHGRLNGPSPRFSKLLADCARRKVDGGLGLSHMLLNVIQRVPRYLLLINQLIRHTPEHHDDYVNLDMSREKLSSVAEDLEAAMRRDEAVIKLLEIQKSMEGLPHHLVVPGRRLLKQSKLMKDGRRGILNERSFFLFSDMLIYARVIRESGESTQVKSFIQYQFCRQLMLDSLTAVGSIETCKESLTNKYCIQLISPTKSLKVFTSTAKERDDWLSSIRQAQHDLRSAKITLKDVDNSKTNPQPTVELQRSNTSSSPVFARVVSWIEPDRPLSIASSNQEIQPIIPLGSPIITTTTDKEESSKHVRGGVSGSSSSSTNSSSHHQQVVAKTFEAKVVENYHAPIWMPDYETSRCKECHSNFTKWWWGARRHHCRICGQIFCGSCTTKMFIIPGFSVQQRGCNQCYFDGHNDDTNIEQIRLPLPLLTTRPSDDNTLLPGFAKLISSHFTNNTSNQTPQDLNQSTSSSSGDYSPLASTIDSTPLTTPIDSPHSGLIVTLHNEPPPPPPGDLPQTPTTSSSSSPKTPSQVKVRSQLQRSDTTTRAGMKLTSLLKR